MTQATRVDDLTKLTDAELHQRVTDVMASPEPWSVLDEGMRLHAELGRRIQARSMEEK